jgi:hypothetical protein
MDGYEQSKSAEHIVAGPRTFESTLTELGIQLSANNLVVWMLQSRDHPRNWSKSRKLFDTVILGALELFT